MAQKNEILRNSVRNTGTCEKLYRRKGSERAFTACVTSEASCCLKEKRAAEFSQEEADWPGPKEKTSNQMAKKKKSIKKQYI